ncbi:hypothetical protein [Sphingomonas sp.]|uniref:hypothetical protein n=1 Tax=Sphingomonas sp. TaxID=28214 RepID=UPI002D7FA055|nr:hypothetical protein [Sphingomonas sp.]HEU0043788.1 hypothetical protein [Sphingomonas sp.]
MRYGDEMRFTLALLLLLAACNAAPQSQQQDLDALDRELSDANSAGNARDPAIADALAGQIMVDPNLAQSSNANAVGPATRPDSGAMPLDIAGPDPVDPATLKRAPAATGNCPQCTVKAQALTLGALAGQQPGAKGCATVSYSARWANRLPADLPLYPDARVIEAAGNAQGSCRLRVVSFASSAAPTKLIDWYYTRATAARYSAEHRADGGMRVLGGSRGGDAYIVYVTPRPGGGSDVDLVSNAGT